MNLEIQQQLIDWMKNLANVAAEELPTFVQEIATYGVYSNITVASICFIVCLIGLIFVRIIWEFKPNKEEKICILLAYIVFCLIPVAKITVSTSQAIKAKCAPRLYAIERITKG